MHLLFYHNDDFLNPGHPALVKSTKPYGYITADLSEYAIHRRMGRKINEGPGISFLVLPCIDSYDLIPCGANRIAFTADQITSENQGVEVTGFAIWRISDPLKAGARFNFNDSGQAIEMMGRGLKDVVESAIRHQAANMSIEEVLRKRGSIILRLKSEVSYMAGQWGVEIDTVEVLQVKIQSQKLFQQMQSSYRDSMRLLSETSAMQTDREIAERQLAQKEELAKRQHLAEQKSFDLKAALEEFKLQRTYAKDAVGRRLELEALPEKIALLGETHRRELEEKEQQKVTALIQEDIERARIATQNTQSPLVSLARELPGALGTLQLKSLSLGDSALQQLLQTLPKIS